MLAKKYERTGKFVTTEVNVGGKISVVTFGLMLPGIDGLVVVRRGALSVGDLLHSSNCACVNTSGRLHHVRNSYKRMSRNL